MEWLEMMRVCGERSGIGDNNINLVGVHVPPAVADRYFNHEWADNERTSRTHAHYAKASPLLQAQSTENGGRDKGEVA